MSDLLFLKSLAHDAGKIILDIYRSGSFGIEVKSDQTPVTLADHAASERIEKALSSRFGIPVFSEESKNRSIANGVERYWVVDPLDGTKDFIAKNGEFCVLMALIELCKPIVGMLYGPVQDEFYFAEKGKGAQMIQGGVSKALPLNRPEKIILARSRFHDSPVVDEFAKMNHIDQFLKQGSGLKFARVACGDASIYPRFYGAHSWDIAAGQLLVQEAGGHVISLATGQEPVYSMPVERHGPLLVVGPGLETASFQMPALIQEVRK